VWAVYRLQDHRDLRHSPNLMNARQLHLSIASSMPSCLFSRLLQRRPILSSTKVPPPSRSFLLQTNLFANNPLADFRLTQVLGSSRCVSLRAKRFKPHHRPASPGSRRNGLKVHVDFPPWLQPFALPVTRRAVRYPGSRSTTPPRVIRLLELPPPLRHAILALTATKSTRRASPHFHLSPLSDKRLRSSTSCSTTCASSRGHGLLQRERLPLISYRLTPKGFRLALLFLFLPQTPSCGPSSAQQPAPPPPRPQITSRPQARSRPTTRR